MLCRVQPDQPNFRGYTATAPLKDLALGRVESLCPYFRGYTATAPLKGASPAAAGVP